LAIGNKARETHLAQAWKHPICTPAPDSARDPPWESLAPHCSAFKSRKKHKREITVHDYMVTRNILMGNFPSRYLKTVVESANTH